MKIKKAMKTIHIPKLYLGMAILSGIAVSCQKDPKPSDQPPPKPSTEKNLIIQDNGLVNGDVRNMQVLFTSHDYSLINSSGVTTGTSAIIKARFFSNEDCVIPSGTYFYAKTTEKLPFTFTDATIQLPDNSVVNGVLVIYSGTVSVTLSDSLYTVSFNGVLSNGDSFSANYVGHLLTYSDNF